MSKLRLILLGAPGAGKGTQAGLISQKLDLAHISSGDLLREAQSKGTELGKAAKSYMEKGLLVPDEIVIGLILEHIAAPQRGGGFILDGFPRTLEQARALDEALGEKNLAIDRVIYVNISVEELLHRLSGRWLCQRCQTPYHVVTSPPKVTGRCDRCGGELYQRPDDSAEAVQKRLEVYFAQTTPLIEYYQQRGKLIEVNGGQDIPQVNEEIIALLD